MTTLLLAGCNILPEPKPDPTRFYVLSSAGAASPAAAATTLTLRPVEVASYLRGRSVIVRRGEHEIQFREHAHWGEGLDLGIARVLREELLARGIAAAPAAVATGVPDAAVSVRVLACEGSADGTVLFRATWALAKADTGEVTARGDYRAGGLVWDVKNEGSLAARLSEAVAGLANEIAGAAKK